MARSTSIVGVGETVGVGRERAAAAAEGVEVVGGADLALNGVGGGESPCP